MHIEQKTSGSLSVIIVGLLFGIVALCMLPFPAWADTQSDLKAAETAAEEAKAAYNSAVDEYEQAVSELDAIQGRIEESERFLSEDQEKARVSAKVLYTQSGDRLSLMMELLFSGKSLPEIISQIEDANKVFNYHEENILRVRDDIASLESQREDAQKAADEKEARKGELETAMDEALAAYDEAQAAAVAAQRASSGSSAASLGDYGADKVSNGASISVSQLKFMGVVYANGWKYTYYSESVLPGNGLSIPGRHHEDGKVCDGDGYICVASSDLPKGTVVPTPLGPGKVYDSGCASGTLDLYLA